MRAMSNLIISIGLLAGTAACDLQRGSAREGLAGDDTGADGHDDGYGDGVDDDGYPAEVEPACVGEPDLPYDVKIQCGDSVIPVVAAFREKNGPDVRFAPIDGRPADCPFVIEGAVIRADEVGRCAVIEATEADAAAAGNKDAGRDRVEVTWCWYAGGSSADADGCCRAEADAAIECETDHLDIRFSCDGGEGAPDDADAPLAGGSECSGDGGPSRGPVN